ncbi:MAG: DMT family protein [Nitrospirae bacterium]|nr:DMT family protein [Nitrospirota bacterium]
MKTVLLLVASNVFMTTAWYGHLRFKSAALWSVVLISWLIALPEYALQVPANRIGHGTFTAPQLKIIQEVVSISVFIVFCLTYLREPIRWNYLVSFGLIVAAVVFALWDRPGLLLR